MHVTDVTLCVYKQNLNAGLLQQHHFWAGLMAIFRVAVLLFLKSKLESGEITTNFTIIKPKLECGEIAGEIFH